jgi:hypothetical protein
MRILVLFNLKDGVSEADYEAWAVAHDLPGVNALPSVDAFRVWKSKGLLMGDGAPPYRYFEIIDVNDPDGFQKDVGSDAVQALAADFGRLADAVFVVADEIR